MTIQFFQSSRQPFRNGEALPGEAPVDMTSDSLVKVRGRFY